MTSIAWIFDALLVATLIGLAWQSLLSSDLFKAVVLFIAFGLLMALAWVRLQAPDVALAEAALGAGLTGALFLSALGHIQPRNRRQDSAPQNPPEDLPHDDDIA